MFNGYNETQLISYEFNQERVDKKQENVAKWSYVHDAGVQPSQAQQINRQEFWSGKSHFVGVPNLVKCNCPGCYSSSENQSYQGDNARHRPWLPRTFPVSLNGSSESCKLPAYQWENALSNTGSFYPDSNLPYAQENGGKHPYYMSCQNSRLLEPNQPGVITSMKNAEYGRNAKGEISCPAENGVRFCSSGSNLTRRANCDPNEKYSNVASYSVDQYMPRLPVEPFIKAVPSNLSQNRVPSTSYRSIKENMPQPYIDSAYGDTRKLSTESLMSGEKRSDAFPTGQLHMEFSHINRSVPEVEPQKLYFSNTRHPDYYPKNNFQDMIKRTQNVNNRKDCAMPQINLGEKHYTSRSKYLESGNDAFYPKNYEKTPSDNTSCFQRLEEGNNENINVHSRLPRSALFFNDSQRTQNSFPYQSNPDGYRNHLRSEYPCQSFNPQSCYDYPGGYQRTDVNQYRATPQPMQTCKQFISQSSEFVSDPNHQENLNKTQQFYGVQTEPQTKSTNYLEAIRSEEINKNGASKISPLRLLRKKKQINVPHESVPSTNLDSAPGLDVRKFWSTWAEEEEEDNVTPAQVVVLDCQNIDPEQATIWTSKAASGTMLHLYETDPVPLESESLVPKSPVKETPAFEGPKTCQPKLSEPVNEITQQEDTTKLEQPDPEANKPERSSPKTFKKYVEICGKKKTEIMDKWTEKKFDFLKRAEESKAAEMLRHEEEKKKIMETRQSLQESLKKFQETEEKIEDENCQNNSPDKGADLLNLPTSEYRRNKFLDYSYKKVSDIEHSLTNKPGADEVKTEKVENQKQGIFLTSLKQRDEPVLGGILQKISEINSQNPEIKLESEDLNKKKTKKLKKKKTEHAPENGERTDKLTVETVTKPTIKFSIQKSHDLKISFKVLNSKEYLDEDLGGENAVEMANTVEESKNSTELITLKYKSIQNDGDRRHMSELKKCRRRKEKVCAGKKTPVFKISKSRRLPLEERDPLAEADERNAGVMKEQSDDFQVQETMDSAKIKLTFKRHKGNFETEYKVNGGSLEKTSEIEPIPSDDDPLEEVMKIKCEKSGRARKIFAVSGIKPFQDYFDATDSGSETPKTYSEPVLNDDSNNFTPSHDSYTEEELENYNFDPGILTFSEFSADPVETVTLSNESGKYNAANEFKSNEKTDKNGKEQTERGVNNIINDDEDNGSQEFTLVYDNSSSDVKEPMVSEIDRSQQKKEIQEISLDFITSAKSEEICLKENSKHSDSSYETKSKFNERQIFGEKNRTPSLSNSSLLDFESVDTPDRKKTTIETCTSYLEFEKSNKDLMGDDSSFPEEYNADVHASPSAIVESVSLDTTTKQENPLPETTETIENDDSKFSIQVKENFPVCEISLEQSPETSTAECLLPIERACCEQTLKTEDEKKERNDPPGIETTDYKVDVEENRCGSPQEKKDGVSYCSLETFENSSQIETVSSEPETNHSDKVQNLETNHTDPKAIINFIIRKINRRQSTDPVTSHQREESLKAETWSNRKFSKSKSCPPGLKLPGPEKENISIENIPLPLGPPPFDSCFDLKNLMNSNFTEAKEKPKESIFARQNSSSCCRSPFGLNDLQSCRNPSPPPQLEIFQRSSKIKFSISKRNRFTKINVTNAKTEEESKRSNAETPDFVINKKIRTPENTTCPVEAVPNVANKTQEEIKKSQNEIELLCEDLEESVEVMSDFLHDELYEDIPTSEDLTNGDDLENEKVNDDKFRNIMQNCLDNAKKFLNVANLKLFSGSVDDLLELDCQGSGVEENEPLTHISRDVLLTSCEDTNDDLGLSENIQPTYMSMDFEPSFCSDACPEILPVDNWPYLEEEVPSSPARAKPDESDLILPLENEIPEQQTRKRVTSETTFDRSSKSENPRRNTIESFVDSRLKNGTKTKSLKCRLNLDKLTSEHGMGFDFKKNGAESTQKLNYKSPSWQPKVILFRISKKELKKAELQRRLKDSTPKEDVIPASRRKSESEGESVYVKPEHGARVETQEKKLFGLDSVKGSLNVSRVCPDRKRKKSRFRNLHTKGKNEYRPVIETMLTEMFKENAKGDDKKPKKNCENHKREAETMRSFEKSKEDIKRHERVEEGEVKHKHRHGHIDRKTVNGTKSSEGCLKYKSVPEHAWVCEVCGFDNPEERVFHIKNHPFHCQSCHLAFRTEGHFTTHLTRKHKDIRNQHHCLLCELSFDTEEHYQKHLETREHRHLESVEKNTINTLFTLLTGAPCPVLGLVDIKPEWMPRQAGTVHFYHQATPLSLALQYLKMHRDLSSFSTTSSAHPT